MIRGAIFDIDGTLLDSMPIWNDCGAVYLRKLGVTQEPGLGELLFPMTLEQSSAYLKEHYGLRRSEAEIRQGVLEVVAEFYREQAPLKPGAKELLEQLRDRGIPMILATTGDAVLARAALERLGVWQFFRGMLTASELQTSKHEPKIYLEAASLLGTEPAETAVFEDVLYAVETAKAAGFFTVAVADDASAGDEAALRHVADVYLHALNEYR